MGRVHRDRSGASGPYPSPPTRLGDFDILADCVPSVGVAVVESRSPPTGIFWVGYALPVPPWIAAPSAATLIAGLMLRGCWRPLLVVDSIDHYGNRRQRVERLVSAWNPGPTALPRWQTVRRPPRHGLGKDAADLSPRDQCDRRGTAKRTTVGVRARASWAHHRLIAQPFEGRAALCLTLPPPGPDGESGFSTHG